MEAFLEPIAFNFFNIPVIFYGFFNPTIVEINNFPIKYYSLMYIIGTLVGIRICKYHARELKIPEKKIESYANWIVFPGILGARIYCVLTQWDHYKDNIGDIFAFWKGIQGLAIHGGIIGGAIGVLILSYKEKVSFWTLGDLAAAPVLVGQSIGRIGNLINGEAHGVPTFTPLNVIFTNGFDEWWETRQFMLNDDLKALVPWGIVFPPGTIAGEQFPNIPIHPTMIYESLLNLMGAALIFFYFRRKKFKAGTLGLIYILTYSVVRSFVTMFKADDAYILGIRGPLLTNALFIVMALTAMYIRGIYQKEERVIEE